MAIIINTKDDNGKYSYLNIFPDQFKSDKEKEEPSYIKNTLDYFANKAYSEYVKNKNTFVKNYDLIKGILRPSDFYEDENVKSFTEMLTRSAELPKHVQNYSIITPPINELVGELTKRPDTYKVKAFDDESKSEELEFKTELLEQFLISQVKSKILNKLTAEGNEDVSEEELQQLTLEKIGDELDAYTSVGEKWGNHMLTALKAEFNIKELSEEAFRDLQIVAREFYHIYEDNSKTGFNVEVVNPKNFWQLTMPDRKYVTDVTGRARGAYAAGMVHVMELSEIIEACPELTKEEIDHLRKGLEDYGLINTRESNLTNGVNPGQNSITYDTYDPLVLQSRMIIEADMKENVDELQDFLGLSPSVSSFGYKYIVCTNYWYSKKEIGELTYLDEFDMIQSILVDRTYTTGDHPQEISLKWGYVNQLYWGRKIGPDIYHMKPFKTLPYIPLIGTVFEAKNTQAKSMVDMAAPFQVIYNVCITQMWELLKKEIGNVGNVNIRRIPRVKDGDGQDDIDIWEMEARERGIIFDDDSPENTKAPVSNQTVARNIDLTRTNEIQSRYTLAVQMKNECWELLGMSKERMGSVAASQTATGTNTAIQQSYTQTEPLFVAHEYVLGQLYQAILDTAQYIESTKETSTLSYITNQGESAFISVKGEDIALRDLKVFMTNRPEDTQLFSEIRALSQAVIQNGGTLYDVIEMYSDNSIRSLKGKFKRIKQEVDARMQQEQELEKQKLAILEQHQKDQLAQIEKQAELKMQNDNHQAELDRINAKEIAQIRALTFGKVDGMDANNNNVPDIMENAKFQQQRIQAINDNNLKIKDIESKYALGMRKLDVDLKNQANDLQIAKENAKNRNKKQK